MEVASLLHTVSSLISHYKPSLINQTACIKLFLSARGQKLHLKNKKVGEKAKMNFKVGNIIISNVFSCVAMHKLIQKIQSLPK